MNSDTPNVPITTLAGITSLTDLLPELPLPSAIPQASSRSLLFHPKIAEEARNVLATRDDKLVSQLVHALRQTNTDYIELKDSLGNEGMTDVNMPLLLQSIMQYDPLAFKGGPVYDTAANAEQCRYRAPNPGFENYQGSSSNSLYPAPFPNMFQGSDVVPSNNVHFNYPTHSMQDSSYLVNGNMYPNSVVASTYAQFAQFQNQPTMSSPAQAASAPAFQSKQPQVSRTGNLTQQTTFVQAEQQKGGNSSQIQGIIGLGEHIDRNRARDSTAEEPVYSVVSSGSTNKLTLKISKAKIDESKATGVKRQWSDDNGAEGDQPAMGDGGAFSSTLSERVKRRKRIITYREDGQSDDEAGDGANNSKSAGVLDDAKLKKTPKPFDVNDVGVDDPVMAAIRSNKQKSKSKSRVIEAELNIDEVMEMPVFKKFISGIDKLLESAEMAELPALSAENEEEIDTSLTESVFGKALVSTLCSEAAKLKSNNLMRKISTDKLAKLLGVLQYSIRDGAKITPIVSTAEEGKEDDHLWKELAVERVSMSVESSLAALYVMTAGGMPKEVFIEDVIEKITQLVKFQLNATIYPEFDPVYRVDPGNKSGIVSNAKLKRARSTGTKNKATLLLYNKLTELIGCLADLVDIQELTDTLVLQLSTLSVSPFFVENISELQLSSLKLVTNLFTRYEKHRQLIMEDILSSLARLPSSKKNMRSYRLNAEEQIQMMTALAMQLIQCVVRMPKPDADAELLDDKPKSSKSTAVSAKMDGEVVVVTSYETAMKTAHNFLTVFLHKCTVKGEENYRALFENFVYDILSAVNKPEWPAAELLLSLLGRLLVLQFSSKSVEQSLRLASIDYLGIVAARLRKDAVSSQLSENTIREILRQMRKKNDDDEDIAELPPPNQGDLNGDDVDLSQQCQEALLYYLTCTLANDPALMFAKNFYIAQWYRDTGVELGKAVTAGSKPQGADEDEESEEMRVTSELERTKEAQQRTEQRKQFLFEKITARPNPVVLRSSTCKLSYENACLLTRYLASKRPFSQSFDIYLRQILKVLCENAISVRTKAMKSLTQVVEADPSILSREDMQSAVNGRFLDQSTSVREAAVELVGRFILIKPELTAQYYTMLANRILDTGISVRKRVIKIFRDICLEQPDFNRIPEICVKMIRRVNDEEGIKKLINETFQLMWFQPTKRGEDSRLLTRVTNITDVVAACKDTGYEWFEQLLDNLLKKEEDASSKPVLLACEQMVNCLVENVMMLEAENVEREGLSPRLIACFATLGLIAKVQPILLVRHVLTIQPYLNIRCMNQSDQMVIYNVAKILEQAVPLMEHPSPNFLTQLEEDMMKLILKQGTMILQSCVSCLGSVVNNVTHNYKLIADCFQKYFSVLTRLMSEHQRDPHSAQLLASLPTLRRTLFTVGLFCRYFDFDAIGTLNTLDKRVSVKDRVFELMMYFLRHEEEEVKNNALTGLGFLATRHFEVMLSTDMKLLYNNLLTNRMASVRMRCQVLKNVLAYLVEEEVRMMKADSEWKKTHAKEDLKELGDIQSGMASTVIQMYLKQILEAYFSPQNLLRMTVLQVIALVLKQGLVHPVQCVPYLISMSSDCDSQIRNKADQELQEIDKKYPGFIQMKAVNGMKLSYRLQEVLQQDPSEPLRGFRMDEQCVSLNHNLYSSLRGTRNHRRALLTNMLNMFDDTQKAPLRELLYMADNIAYFPYQVVDEPLFIMHQIDILVSVTGPNILQGFNELFNPNAGDSQLPRSDDDEEEDVESLIAKLPAAYGSQLVELHHMSRGCVLLLLLKQHLKDAYGFTDSKVQQYSPNDPAKSWDTKVNKKVQKTIFTPKPIIDILRRGDVRLDNDEAALRQVLADYLEFKEMMLNIDRDEGDDDDVDPNGISAGASSAAVKAQKGPQMRVTQPRVVLHAPDDDGAIDGNVSAFGANVSGDMTLNDGGENGQEDGTPSSNKKKAASYRLPDSMRKKHHSKTPRSKGTPGEGKVKAKKKKRHKFMASDDSSDSGEDPSFDS